MLKVLAHKHLKHLRPFEASLQALQARLPRPESVLILFQAAWDFYLPWYAAKTPGFGFIFNAARNGLLLLNQSKLLEVLHVDKDSPIFQSLCLTK